MSINEIKCPTCGQWSNWNNKVEETCQHCGHHLDPGRFRYTQEQKIIYDKNRKDGFMVIKADDDPIIKLLKEMVNWVRWTTFYGISVIYIVIAFMVILYGLVMI